MTLSCAVTVIKFCVGLGKFPKEMMKLIRNSETMNPCSVSVVYKWHERFRNGRKSTENGFEGWSALSCENDFEGHHFMTLKAHFILRSPLYK